MKMNSSAKEQCVSLFRQGVERVLTNWTALKLAVDHGTGGPKSRELATNLVQYVGDLFCSGGRMEPEDLSVILEDFMDTNFDTWCEDNSPDEVAAILFKLYQYCSQLNVEELRKEVGSLSSCRANESREMQPIGDDQCVEMERSHNPAVIPPLEVLETIDVSNEMPEEDPGWTQVSRRRIKPVL